MVVVVAVHHHLAIYPFYQALQIDIPTAICCNDSCLYNSLQ